MHMSLPCLPVRWIAAGFLAGACLTFAGGETAKTAPPSDNLVVVLKGEKTITLDKPHMRLREIAAEMAQQTGRSFTLDKTFQDDETPYAVLLDKTPLSRVLSATAYVANGTWERHGLRYRLRQPTPAEMNMDADRAGAAATRVAAYLSSIPNDDKSLPADVLTTLRTLQTDISQQPVLIPPVLDDDMANWKLSASEHGLGISYQTQSTSGSQTTGSWKGTSWGWE